MTTNDSKDQGREAFEAWWEDDSVTFRHHESDPSGSHIDTAWQAWQAALATSASALASDAASQEPVTTQPKPVMWVILDRDGDLIAQSMTEIKGLDWQPLYAAPVPRQAEAVSGASALARDEAKELCARCNCWVRPSDDCNLCRSADDAKPVGEAVSVALTDDRIIDIWCNTPTTRFGGEVEDQEIIDFARVLLDASPAASTATVSDAASVALTDELPGATAALRDLLSAKDLPNEQGALARVRGENMQKAWEHARALLAASQAATGREG